MSRYVPPDYVLLEEAYKEIIGNECECIDKDSKFTEEEKELLLLMNKYATLKQSNLEGKNHKIPKELLGFESHICDQTSIAQAIRSKKYQHKELIRYCNMLIFQSGVSGTLDAKLIITEGEQYILNGHQMLHLEHFNILKNSQGHITIHDESINSEIVKHGHIVLQKEALQKHSQKIIKEVTQYNEGVKWDPDQRRKVKTTTKNYKGTGAPGRPTSWDHIVEPYFKKRMKNKLCETSVTNEAIYLSLWLKDNNPNEPVIKPTTMQNKIRDQYRAYKIKINQM